LFARRPGLEDKPENYSITSCLLTEENGHTTLEIRQHVDGPGAVQEEHQGKEKPVLQGRKKIPRRIEGGAMNLLVPRLPLKKKTHEQIAGEKRNHH
jgi:hypothetical protein